MILNSVRQTLKQSLLEPNIGFLAQCFVYVRRLAVCIEILFSVGGYPMSDNVRSRHITSLDDAGRQLTYSEISRAGESLFSTLTRWLKHSVWAGSAFAAAPTTKLVCFRATTERILLPTARTQEAATPVGDGGAKNRDGQRIHVSRLVGEGGRVIVVWTMTRTAARLRQTIVLDDLRNVTLVEKALSEHACEILAATVEPGLHGQASIARPDRRGREEMTVEVETTTIEAMLAGIGEVALLKLDLEGAEAAALRGTGASLTRVRAILFESWKGDGGEAGAMLREAGYELHPVDGRNFLAVRLSSAR